MNRRFIYTASAVLFFVSVATVVFLHYFQLQLIGDLAAIPAIGALFSAIFQLLRDNIAFERTVGLEEFRNTFTIGATSHMANVSFDKHALFCEDYIAETYRVLEALFRTGPHEDAIAHARALYEVRKRHATWLTPQIESILERFEAKIRSIGANAQLVAAVPGEQEAINEMFSQFADVFGAQFGFKEWKGEPVSEEHSIAAIIDHLRAALGIGDLTRLRSELIGATNGESRLSWPYRLAQTTTAKNAAKIVK